MLWWFWVDSEGAQPYIYTHPLTPRLPCPPGCHMSLSRVPWAVQHVLVGYPCSMQQCVHVHPKLPNYPSFPPATISLFSKSVNLFLDSIWVIYGLIWQIFIDSLLYVRHCSRPEVRQEQWVNRQKALPLRSFILMGDVTWMYQAPW